jgi:hypothetical protein
LLQKVKTVVSDKKGLNRTKLQNLLSEIGKEREQGQVESESSDLRLEALLGGDAVAYIRDSQSGDSNLRYLYDLTLGSRPDALIVDESRNVVVLLENKIHGCIVGVQIERHIRENFGEHFRPQWVTGSAQIDTINEKEGIPVRICGWRKDIYPFLKSFQGKAECHDDGKVCFLVAQFLQYLEVIGMGEIKFNRDDFLEWESYNDPDSVRNLLDRVECLGESLAGHLGEHWVHRQKISRNYLGVNIVHNRYEEKGNQPVNVPHWSLAIQQHGPEDRCLRLFIPCESKKLGELVLKNRNMLQRKLATTLQNARREAGIVLRVMEKSHLIQGGKGRNEGVWNTYFSFPLELCRTPKDVEPMVAKAFEAMSILHDPHVREKRMKKWPDMPRLKGKTIVGVFELNYQLNWLELENQGIAISAKMERIVEVFRPYYDVLLELMQQAVRKGG